MNENDKTEQDAVKLPVMHSLPGFEDIKPSTNHTADVKQREARLAIMSLMGGDDEPEWMGMAAMLAERGYDQTMAIVAAWSCLPEGKKESKKELAERLGFANVNPIYKRLNSAEIRPIQLALSESNLLQALATVDRANIAVASREDYKGAKDRELFYKRLGLIGGDRVQVGVQVVNQNDVSQMSAEQRVTQAERIRAELAQRRAEKGMVIEGETADAE